MVESTSRWDAQGLGFGLAFGLLGLVFLMARHDHSLRPVHLLGVVVLAAGAAVLVAALDRSWPELDRAEVDRIDLTRGEQHERSTGDSLELP